MKRPKKCTPKIMTTEVEVHILCCPHCKTELRGSIGRDTLRMGCWHCKNPIDIEWDKMKRDSGKEPGEGDKL